MPRLVDVPTHELAASWHAAAVVLTMAFPRDHDVWSRVSLGERADLVELYRSPDRPMPDRVLLAFAQGLVDDTGPFGELVRLPDAQMRLFLDALAIARGSLPVD